MASQMLGRTRGASGRLSQSTYFIGSTAAAMRGMAFKTVSPPITYIAGEDQDAIMRHAGDQRGKGTLIYSGCWLLPCQQQTPHAWRARTHGLQGMVLAVSLSATETLEQRHGSLGICWL